jgi:hypothetical protein
MDAVATGQVAEAEAPSLAREAEDEKEEDTMRSHVPVTAAALAAAAAAAAASAAEICQLTGILPLRALESDSRRHTPLSFTGTTISTVRAPIQKRPRLQSGSRLVRSNTPFVSYHIPGANTELPIDQNLTYHDEERRGPTILRDPGNPSFILRRG